MTKAHSLVKPTAAAFDLLLVERRKVRCTGGLTNTLTVHRVA